MYGDRLGHYGEAGRHSVSGGQRCCSTSRGAHDRAPLCQEESLGPKMWIVVGWVKFYIEGSGRVKTDVIMLRGFFIVKNTHCAEGLRID